jgi:large repetitive protein
MRLRFIHVLALLCVGAGAFAGVARALDFDVEDPDPVQGEIGRVIDYTVGTHAGCLPHRLVIDSGEIPPGTTLTRVDDHTSVIEGIPTEAGTFKVWLEVRDCADKSAQALFTFEIGQRTYAIQTASLPAAALNQPYSTKLQAGGHPIRSEEWVVSAGALPAGLTLAKDGTINGTPTAPGSSRFTVKATSVGDDDAIRVDTRELTLSVTGTFTVAVGRRTAEVGVPFRSSFTVSGGQAPYTWSATGLPPGLSVGSDGAVTGVPTRAGSYATTVRFVDANGASSSAPVTLVVRPRLAVATNRLRAAVAGHAYSAAVAIRGGVGGFTWSITRGALPRGLKLAARTGRISGAAHARGTVRFTVRVKDSLGAVASKSVVLSVR